MNQKEKRLKKWLVGNLKKYRHGEVVFIEPGYGSTDGLPDCIVLLYGYSPIYIELKADRNKPLRRSQKKMVEKFFKFGIYIYRMYWYDIEETKVCVKRIEGLDFYFEFPKKNDFFGTFSRLIY